MAVTTESGLVYDDLIEGSGAEAAAGQYVTVHYTGWLTDGSKFDSSKDRNDPFQFHLGQRHVIAGWDEGVAGMKVGGTRKLTIPPNLGYGARGAGGVIPPNATLVFDVELLDVKLTTAMLFASKLPAVGTTIFTVMSRLAAEHGAINLSQGFPDFSPPARLLERVTHHMAAGANQYPPMAGVLPLREAITEKVGRLYGARVDVESEVTVTAGATQAIFTAISACVRPGDEVIVFAPVYDSYAPGIELNGGTVKYAHLRFPDYRPDWDEVRALVTPRTRMILINSPHNPSGAVWAAADMLALERLVAGTDIVVVSDEVYEHMVFDGARHESVLRYPRLAERSFVVSSFGKTYHVTGWKIAYCVAPRELMAEFRKAHQFIVFTVHHPSQLALADFMREAPEFADGLAAFYQGKRDFFRRQLEGSRFTLLPSAGTYFQLAQYDAISDEPDTEFVRRLTTEHGVAAIPVSVFSPTPSPQRVIRFCFAKNEDTLAEAGVRLRAI